MPDHEGPHRLAAKEGPGQIGIDYAAPLVLGHLQYRLIRPRDTADLTVQKSEVEPAWYHGTCGTLILEDCRVPANNLLEGKGAASFRSGSGGGKNLQWNAIDLGAGRAAYEAALAYAKLRVQGGRRIIEHEGVGMMLADMAVRLEAGRSMIWQAAWAADHPDAYADRSLPDLPLPLLTDVFISETVYEVAVKAAEVFGAMGILRDMPLHGYVHDAQIFNKKCVKKGRRS